MALAPGAYRARERAPARDGHDAACATVAFDPARPRGDARDRRARAEQRPTRKRITRARDARRRRGDRARSRRARDR
jgi:hypothetical protein